MVRPTAGGVVAAALVVVAAAVCVRLGFWQLDRLEDRRTRNEAIRAATALPPLTLDAEGFRAAADADPAASAWRRAEAAGRFLPAGEQVVRGRSRDGRPGVLVATPLAAEHGTVIVLRGWVPAPDGATIDRGAVAAPGGEVRVSGVLVPLPADPRRGVPIPTPRGDSTWRGLEVSAASGRAPGPVLPLYLQLLADGRVSDGPPFPEPLPELTAGSHLGYAVQWFSFAAIALVGLAVVVARRSG
jgi:surfeit locus 1 family protein